MRRFYAPDLAGKDTIELSPEESRHASSVLRLKEGDVIGLFDGKGVSATGIVLGRSGKRLRVAVTPVREAGTAGPRITLAVAAIRPERMELIIQKACELGAAAIAPLMTERSIIRLSKDRWQAKTAKWRRTALESCKQCGRAEAPVVEEPRPFRDFINDRIAFDGIILPTLAREGIPLHRAFSTIKGNRLLILIGPEGDFTPDEAALAVSKGAQSVTLGSLVMRSETAALYVLAAAQFYWQSR
ncbi:MAG: hypothetical protein A3D28_04320 [Omnitrophica bacterium RIFCSPHIGHO2_02_FULL_63_14]|nr:MAG: hypothetical protein A3D28_04320 [Omnitrophica bacterium RIFCSPHIGHO2_02_FULL_63_14]